MLGIEECPPAHGRALSSRQAGHPQLFASQWLAASYEAHHVLCLLTVEQRANVAWCAEEHGEEQAGQAARSCGRV